jgi:hypothetical protein
LDSRKDEGLMPTGLCETIEQNTGCAEHEVILKTAIMPGSKQRKIQNIPGFVRKRSVIFFLLWPT